MIPIIHPEVRWSELAESLYLHTLSLLKNDASCFCQQNIRQFAQLLQDFFSKRYCIFTSSGRSALFYILKYLKSKYSAKNEVILPAYTASAVLTPVLALNLKPVFVDISLETFNVDIDKIPQVLSEKTLAVVIVHMFGIPNDMYKVRNYLGEVNVIEDCAQSFGSMYDNKPVGSFCRESLLSFARGKNLSFTAGGAIITSNDELYGYVNKTIHYNFSPAKYNADLYKLCLLKFITSPPVYGRIYKVVDFLRKEEQKIMTYKNIQNNFNTDRICQMSLIGKMTIEHHLKYIFPHRHKVGMRLMELLKGMKFVKLPQIQQNSYPVFNKFPIVVEGMKIKKEIYRKLLLHNIESSFLYGYTLPSLVGDKRTYPNAEYFSKHLLVLPVHKFVNEGILLKTQEIIEGVISSC
jgi:dTDP-4-amino-4,6-dideoxygalactose transaminase